MYSLIRTAKIKLFSWEYWPMWLVYLPVSFYYLFLAAKARSFYFFSATNPSIQNGGMFFESKWDIFQLMPSGFYPKTIFIKSESTFKHALSQVQAGLISYPFIAKPDVGGRGNAVKLIYSEAELLNYYSKVKVAFMIQEYSHYGMEVSVFYERKPNEKKGKISSFTIKELLSVEGDGASSIKDLIKGKDRAYLQLVKLKENAFIDFAAVPVKGEKVVLVPFGNHCLGSTFLNANHLIDEELTSAFDAISKTINGFYFGRYDIRCKSIEDLKKGTNFHILELNGAGAEPAHIYQPGYSFIKAQRDLKNYYQSMYQIAAINHSNGINYLTHAEFKVQRKLEREYKSKIYLT